MKKILLCSALLCLLFACDTPNDDIPYRKVGFMVNIASTNLSYVGGYEYFTGGVKGIVVYRGDMNTFYAYDRACPHDWRDGGRVEMVESFYLCDSLCGSKFLILDGSPVSGPAEAPLHRYNAELTDDFTLRVYN